jgi:hypothetical protein
MSKIYVVMSNDFPDCVFDEEWRADIYCEEQKKYQEGLLKDWQHGAAIYYRIYGFEINEPGRLLARSDEHLNRREPTNADQEEFRASLRARWNERRPTKSPGA